MIEAFSSRDAESLESDSLMEGMIFLLMLLVTGVLSSAELAFSSLSRSSLEKLRDDGVKGAQWILRIYRPKREAQLMVAIGRGIALVVATLTAMHWVSENKLGLSYSLGLTIAGGMTVLSFLFFESVFPRIILNDRDETSIVRFGRLLVLLYFGLWPLITVLNWISGLFAKELDSKEAKEEELRNIVESESEEGVIEERIIPLCRTLEELPELCVEGELQRRIRQGGQILVKDIRESPFPQTDRGAPVRVISPDGALIAIARTEMQYGGPMEEQAVAYRLLRVFH